jgi:hypothetical protein
MDGFLFTTFPEHKLISSNGVGISCNCAKFPVIVQEIPVIV